MGFINKVNNFLFNKKARFLYLSKIGFFNSMPDKKYIEKKWDTMFSEKLNLNNPKTFNEKLQWLKLYDRNPLYTTLVDKYEVKKYIADKIGKEYVVPAYGVWDKFDDIDFDSLPDQFVLKCTHDSGGLVICKDKSAFDRISAREKIQKSLKTNYYYSGREWPYKNVKPRVLAEKYMEEADIGDIHDYKFYCFDGEVKALYIVSERHDLNVETKHDFFDADYNHLPIFQGHPNAAVPPKKPINFEKMKELASILSAGIPHVRVDFYEVDGKVYFGEMTFFTYGGFTPFVPEEWDYKFGEWIKLPEKQTK